MRSGKVKYWNSEKGYGFISADDRGKDVWFHSSHWQLPEAPTTGMIVYYDSEVSKQNQLRATKVVWEPSLLSTATMGDRQSAAKTNMAKYIVLVGLFLIALMAVGLVNGLSKPEAIQASDVTPATTTAIATSVTASEAAIAPITGDAQIDKTLYLIQQGGPFPYPEKDGSVFFNREGQLPKQPKGYYHEYTVPTPGASNRGARRIITGGNPPTVYYFTADHYHSFTEIKVPKL